MSSDQKTDLSTSGQVPTHQGSATEPKSLSENPPQPDSLPHRRHAVLRDMVIVFVVAATVAVMIFFAVRRSRTPNQLGPGAIASVHELTGKPAPAFELTALDGSIVRLADYRGKAVMLDFWATWCGPCRIEMPWFPEIQKKYGPQGFTILAVAMDDSGLDAIKRFAREFGANYPILLGKDAIADAYGVNQGFPTNVFIDRDGKVIQGVVGLTGQRELEENIKRALASGSPTATTAAPGLSLTR